MDDTAKLAELDEVHEVREAEEQEPEEQEPVQVIDTEVTAAGTGTADMVAETSIIEETTTEPDQGSNWEPRWLLPALALAVSVAVLGLVMVVALAPSKGSGNVVSSTPAATSYHIANEPGRPGYLPNLTVLTDDEGEVTVQVSPREESGSLVFDVRMDTHSVDLDGYDLARIATLRTATGQEVKPASWQPQGSGHHRSGVLTFPTRAPDGTSIVGPGAGTLELLVYGVANVPERAFKWAQ